MKFGRNGLLTHDKLLHLLDYNRDTGKFVWRRQVGGRGIKNEEAGGFDVEKGCVFIKIENKRYRAHQLAWFYVTGKRGAKIKHKNGIKTDNRFSNLERFSPGEKSRLHNQLISKAPEMLEMLKTLLDNSDVPNEIYDQAKQLIKEATTI